LKLNDTWTLETGGATSAEGSDGSSDSQLYAVFGSGTLCPIQKIDCSVETCSAPLTQLLEKASQDAQSKEVSQNAQSAPKVSLEQLTMGVQEFVDGICASKSGGSKKDADPSTVASERLYAEQIQGAQQSLKKAWERFLYFFCNKDEE